MKCEVEGCDRKYYAKGYCSFHYHQEWGKQYSSIPRFGGTKRRKEQKQRIYTDGVTEEIKSFIPKIKDKVLNDCIKNPRKYLGERKPEAI